MEIHLSKIKVNIALNKTWKLLPERISFLLPLRLKKKFVLFSDFAIQFFISFPPTVSVTQQQLKSTRSNNSTDVWITLSLGELLPTRWLVETGNKVRMWDERSLPENVDSNDSQHQFSHFPMRSLLFFRLWLGTDRLQLSQHEGVEDEYQAQWNGEAQDEGVHGEGEAVGLHEAVVASRHVPALGARRRRPHDVARLFTFGVDWNRRRVKDNW